MVVATTAKTLQCNVKQAKFGMTSWAYAWTQAHKSILIGKAEEARLDNNKCRQRLDAVGIFFTYFVGIDSCASLRSHLAKTREN